MFLICCCCFSFLESLVSPCFEYSRQTFYSPSNQMLFFQWLLLTAGLSCYTCSIRLLNLKEYNRHNSRKIGKMHKNKREFYSSISKWNIFFFLKKSIHCQRDKNIITSQNCLIFWSTQVFLSPRKHNHLYIIQLALCFCVYLRFHHDFSFFFSAG